MEERPENARRLLLAERAALHVLVRSLTLEEASRPLLEALSSHLGVDAAALWLLDAGSKRLRLVELTGEVASGRGGVEKPGRASLLAGEGLPEAVLSRGEPMWIEGAGAGQVDERREAARTTGLHATAAAPVAAGGEVIGVLALLAREGRPRDDEALGVLEAVAAVLAGFIKSRGAGVVEREGRAPGRSTARGRPARGEREPPGRTKDDLLSTISHQLRSPLQSVLGWASMLKHKKLDPEEAAQAIEIIERNARLQAKLLEDIVDMARIEEGTLRLEGLEAALEPALRSAVEDVRPFAEARAVEVHAEIEPDLPTIRVDSERIQRVFWDLLSNAVKFARTNGRVELRAARTPGGVRVDVSDDGAGIPPDQLPVIFDRYQKSTSEEGNRERGRGLGLAVSRSLVEMHGGTIEAQSAGRGRGATFTVRLPCAAAGPAIHDADARQEAGPAEAVPRTRRSLEGLRIVAVDDEPDARDLLLRILGAEGAQVVAVGSAAEALRIIESADRPDVLVCDISMPEVNGYHLIHEVRVMKPEKGGRIPAVALTAYASGVDRMRAIAAGFQSHLAKPIDPGELVKAISGLAGRSPAEPPLLAGGTGPPERAGPADRRVRTG